MASKRDRALAAVVGVGYSRIFRRADVPLATLALEACRQAIADAGLTSADIDGVATEPDQPFGGAGERDGIDIVSPELAARMLGLDSAYMCRAYRLVVNAFVDAANAVATGTCRNVLVFRALNSPDGRYGRIEPSQALARDQFRLPYGADTLVGYALLAQRYMYQYAATREDMAKFIVQSRENGLRWEHSYWHQAKPAPLTVEDVLSARMVAEPLSIYDCDLPVQGCGAFVLTSADRATLMCEHPAYILGMSSNEEWPSDIYEMGLERFAAGGERISRHLWANSGVGPSDVDVANLYDGFSIITPLWLEALGLAPKGEALARIGAGEFSPDSRLPLNTSGGSLGSGRMHGVPHLMESALQVMGRAGDRQVPSAEVAVTTVGGPGAAAGVVFASRM
jgi:acetyl-CoA acetyltransferase